MAENDLDLRRRSRRQSEYESRKTSIANASRLKCGKLGMDRIQASIILCGLYLFFPMIDNIVATKITYFGGLIMDAGLIYTFTWCDLIHKQLREKAAVTTI